MWTKIDLTALTAFVNVVGAIKFHCSQIENFTLAECVFLLIEEIVEFLSSGRLTPPLGFYFAFPASGY